MQNVLLYSIEGMTISFQHHKEYSHLKINVLF